MKMAQPSVAAFFNTRKRAAVEQIGRNSKVLLLNNESDASSDMLENLNNNNDNLKLAIQTITERDFSLKRNKVTTRLKFDSVETMVSPKVQKRPAGARIRKGSVDSKQHDITKLFQNFENKKDLIEIKEEGSNDPLENVPVGQYPSTPTKKVQSTLEQLNSANSAKDNLSLAEIKSKLTRSSRLAELKASIAKINKSAVKLEQIQSKTSKLESGGSSLKSFDKIDLQIPVSPRKAPSTPQKEYLSPSKSLLSSPTKLLSGLSTPTKQKTTISSPSKLAAYQRFASLATSEKSALTLPFKYRCLAEAFRCLDSVCAMFVNRGEIITFKKIKPAVQELLRKNFTEYHLEQIKFIYPESYSYSQDKIRNFGSTSKTEKYQLVITPLFEDTQNVQARMSSSVLLERRRKLFDALIEKVKDYHQEFLSSLEDPMDLPRDQIVRWHPEFDIEKVPDIERSPLPQPPNVETVSSAKDVLAKARNLFSCNTRMEKALQKLSDLQDKQITKDVNEKDAPIKTEIKSESILKGVPKGLLDKIRARQAAKALETMTRAPVKDKEAAKYAQLPDLAKYTRNIFISEKKSVLPIESVINKLNNSFRTSFTPSEIESLLKLLSELLPGWIVFHEIRKAVFIKLAKDTDMTKVLNKLEKIAKDKAND